jgi:hypothetical protein
MPLPADLSCFFAPSKLAAHGLAVETGSHLPVALWFIGAVILGLPIATGIVRNTQRTRAEKQVTDQATKNL